MSYRMWSDEDLAFLRSHVDLNTNLELAVMLGRTEKAIVYTMQRYAIKRESMALSKMRGAGMAKGDLSPGWKGGLSEKQRRTQKKNPCAYRAMNTVNYHLKQGNIHKGPCEVCGATSDVQAHHEDYNKPLQVRWLCRRCHNIEHGRRVV